MSNDSLLLNKIYGPIQGELARVEEMLGSVSHVDFPWLSEMVAYSISGGGKRLRPALVLLSGKIYGNRVEPLLAMAGSVELMHTATLIHDDAIDKSMTRRGKPTINSVWGEEKAILLGDYLFARAGEFAADTGNLLVVGLFTQTLATISSGELHQILSAFKVEQTRDEYFRRIAGKTASLFALSTQSGAILSGATPEAIEILRDYGFNLGIAFQIVDDILDFVGTEAEIGKPVGSDLAQGTLTLPAMMLLERYPDKNPVAGAFKHEDMENNIKRAIDMIRNSNIIDECSRLAAEYCHKACRQLNSLPENPVVYRSLTELAEYLVKRRK